MKAAAFDIDSAYRSAFEGIDLTDASDMGDEVAAELFHTPLLDFYDRIAGLAATAPPEVAGDLETAGGIGEILREAVESGDDRGDVYRGGFLGRIRGGGLRRLGRTGRCHECDAVVYGDDPHPRRLVGRLRRRRRHGLRRALLGSLRNL